MKSSIISAGLLTASIIATPLAYAQIPSATEVTVDQGDIIWVTSDTLCTVGYVDKDNKRAYISDHCATPGKTKSVFNNDGIKIGKVTGKYSYDNPGYSTARKDVAVIELDEEIITGENQFSSNTRLRSSQLTPGESICLFSSGYDSINCGAIHGVDGTLIEADSGAAGIPGDSGGPAWIPGKGFVGVYSMAHGPVDGVEQWHVFTSIDDKDCSGENSMLNLNSPYTGDICPDWQLAEHSPDFVDEDVELDSPVVQASDAGSYLAYWANSALNAAHGMVIKLSSMLGIPR